MPRKLEPPRLYLRRRAGREPAYVIKDNGREHSTGFGEGDRAGAEAALGKYLIARHRAPTGPRTPDDMLIADALNLYATEHAPHTAAPERIGYAVEALLPFWGESKVSAVTAAACRRYAKSRHARPRRELREGEAPPPPRPVSAGTIRRELGALRAALNYCAANGYLSHAPAVVRPAPPAPRERWLTRGEVAALLRAARAERLTRHLARFILVAVYTGTRKADVLALQFLPSLTGGHVDLERGVMHRKSAAARRTKKRATPVKIPRQLLGHLRRWSRSSVRHVVEFRGAAVADIKNGWASVALRAGIADATPHTLKHTAITWAMQRGAKITDAVSFFGTSQATIERTYHHHHPDHQRSAVAALEGRNGG